MCAPDYPTVSKPAFLLTNSPKNLNYGSTKSKKTRSRHGMRRSRNALTGEANEGINPSYTRGAVIKSRRLMLASGFALLALVGGCGADTPQAGIWLGIYDKNDRIEILSADKARVKALFGKPIDAWVNRNPAASGFGQEIRDAENALATFEMVDVTYRYDKENDALVFKSETRGSRTLEYIGGDMMDDKRTLRSYLLQK